MFLVEEIELMSYRVFCGFQETYDLSVCVRSLAMQKGKGKPILEQQTREIMSGGLFSFTFASLRARRYLGKITRTTAVALNAGRSGTAIANHD